MRWAGRPRTRHFTVDISGLKADAVETRGGCDEIAGSEFDRPQAGPEGVSTGMYGEQPWRLPHARASGHGGEINLHCRDPMGEVCRLTRKEPPDVFACLSESKSRHFPRPLMLGLLALGLAPAVYAGQMAVGTFNLLRVGMSEAEVLARAGLPDLDTSIGLQSVETERLIFDAESNATVVGATRKTNIAALKELHYIPGSGEHDPHLTVVTIKSGKVANLARTKLFTRSVSANVAVDTPAFATPSDHDYKIRQLDRTIEAAQEYTRTRARLKAAASAASDRAPKTVEIYSAVQSDGSVYFGDRPPSE